MSKDEEKNDDPKDHYSNGRVKSSCCLLSLKRKGIDRKLNDDLLNDAFTFTCNH